MTTYKAQAARDAAEMGYGDEGYWEYLDQSAAEKYDYYMERGMPDMANHMLTRTISQALMGNDGD